MTLRYFYLSSCGIGLCLTVPAVYAQSHFDPAFFAGDSSAVADLDQLEKTNGLAPGQYDVDVYLNNDFIESKKIKFVTSIDDGETPGTNTRLIPQLTLQDLTTLNVKIDSIALLNGLKLTDSVDIEKSIPDAKTSLDIKSLRLDISIPQAALYNRARGYIPQSQWDQGINALFLNYNLAGNKAWDNDGTSDDNFLSLQSGLNIGAWRLRDNSSWDYNNNSDGSTTENWENISTYVERNIEKLKSELTAGDTSTKGDLFDSVSIRGVKIETDDNMLPDSEKGFAPTIRGIAKGNARVIIRQNGYKLYETYVSPGAFEINDLFPTSSSGDLDVTVLESDGSSQNYTVPYSSVTGLQREGQIQYSFAMGKYHSGSNQQDEPDVGQATVYWGGPGGVTLYGGGQISDNYSSYAVGVGSNLGDFGALALDITEANSTLVDGSHHSGESARLLYEKSLNTIGTTLNFMGYRYSTSGYYTLSDTTYKSMDGYNYHGDDDEYDVEHIKDGDDEPDYADYYDLWYTKKGKLQVSLNQTFGEWGSVYISGTQQTYWHTSDKDTYFQGGYNGAFNGITYDLSYSYNKSLSQPDADQVFAINVSIPLGRWLSPDAGDISNPASNMYLTYNNSTDNAGKMTQLAGVSGTLLQGNNLSYSVQ